LDLALSEAEKALQDKAREFAQSRVSPLAGQIDESGHFPFELLKETAKAGYHGLPFPRSYGGGGAGYLGYTLALEEIARASITIASIIAASVTPQEAVYRFGNPVQKRRLIKPLASGQEIGCIAFTEAGTGSDPSAIKSLSVKKGDSYILSGHKQFVANAVAAHRALVFTRAKDEGEGLNTFLVDAATPGYKVGRSFETMGARGMGVCEVILDRVKVPADNLLGKEGQGYEVLLDAISLERLGVAVQAVGVAQAALDSSLAYVRERKVKAKAIATLPTVQWQLAEMATRIEAGRWLTRECAGERDRRLDIRYSSAVAKLFASQMAVEVTRMGMQVWGTYGSLVGSGIERLYRDAKMTEIYVGVSEIQRVIIASHLV
jgi:butyryl-CoA dehydrogenase